MDNSLQGKRIKLIKMFDPYPVPDGTLGTITHTEDIGTIHVRWDNGSNLGVVPDTDKYEILDNN